MNFLSKVIGIASLVAVLVPSPAKAEWVPISTAPGGYDIYIEDTSIKQTGDLVTFWRRIVAAVPEKRELLLKILINTYTILDFGFWILD